MIGGILKEAILIVADDSVLGPNRVLTRSESANFERMRSEKDLAEKQKFFQENAISIGNFFI